MVVATGIRPLGYADKAIQIELTSEGIPSALFEVPGHDFGDESVQVVYAKGTTV